MQQDTQALETDGHTEERKSSSRQSRQAYAKWGSGLLFTLSLLVTLLLFHLFWLTLPQNATQIISYTVARLSEVDLFLDARYPEMMKYAKANPEGSLGLPEFPVSLTLRCADVVRMSQDELRAHILHEASQAIYLQGWAARGESEVDSSNFLKWSILLTDFLGQKGHRWLRILLPISAICSVLLAIALTHLSRGFRKLISLGACFCAASLFSLLAIFAGELAIKTLLPNGEDPFLLSLQELALILLRILQRGYLVVFSLGLAFIALGFIADRLPRKSRRPA